MMLKFFRIVLFILVWLTLIVDLSCAYYYFFNTYWLEIFANDSEFIHVHSWRISDTFGIFVLVIVSSVIYWLAYKTWLHKTKPEGLKAVRRSIAAISGFVALCNIIFILCVLFFWSWPSAEKLEILEDFPIVWFWVGEMLILIILAVFQIGLGYLTYKAWFPKSPQPQNA